MVVYCADASVASSWPSALDGVSPSDAETASTPHTTDAGEIGKWTNSSTLGRKLASHVASNMN